MRLLKSSSPLPLSLALGAALLAACSENPTTVAHGPSGSNGAAGPLDVEFPLFTELDEEAFDASCAAFRVEQSKAGGKLFTKAPAEIDWAEDIYAAIERAEAEDKPIFLQTHCKENGDPSCDV